MDVSPLVRRILSRLEQAESSEPDPHRQTDYRIAWIAVLYAAQGKQQPNTLATYEVLGLHPDKVWPAMVARRKAQLGESYSRFFDEHGQIRRDEYGPLLPPKKPARSVDVHGNRKTQRGIKP